MHSRPTMQYLIVFRVHKWTIDAMSHGSKKEVQAKKTEALKRLGHKNLKLDEYESASL